MQQVDLALLALLVAGSVHLIAAQALRGRKIPGATPFVFLLTANAIIAFVLLVALVALRLFGVV
jgi:hypothetical protein